MGRRTSRAVDEATRLAQAAASDPRASAWVSANAGSGKTFVLVQRVVRLLLAGADPSRLLCLTFTKAAAAQMATKVFETLAKWATCSDRELGQSIRAIEGRKPDADELVRARRLFAEALETPGGLKIQTIHAFCERLLHQFPFEANVAGHFKVLEERDAAALTEEARRRILARAASEQDGALGKALAVVLDAATDFAVETTVREFLDRRDRLRQWIVAAGSLDAAIRELGGALGLDDGETAAALRRALLAESRFASVDIEKLHGALAESGSKADRDAAERLAPCLLSGDDEERIEGWLAFCMTAEGELRAVNTLVTRRVKDRWPGLAEQIEEEFKRLEALLERIAVAESFETTAAMLRLADAAIGEYERLKRARGVLDFEDLIVQTIQLLSRADASRWVHYKLDRGIDHILVDEAQDTSPRQWQVIKTLVEEFFAGAGAREGVRTLFAVGDEKQSIFSFQGAVPHWFSKMQRELGASARAAGFAWSDPRLNLSFRSVPIILEAVDTVFSVETAYSGLSAERVATVHSAWRQSEPGRVTVWPMIEPLDRQEPDDWTTPLDHLGEKSPEVRLAERIAKTIAGWLVSKEPLGEGEKDRPIRPGDILILSRIRGAQTDAINRALKTRGIAIAGADRLKLTEHIAIMDLMALGRVMLLPEDDLSLAALLKSPLIGLSEDELFALAHGRSFTLWQALGEAVTTRGGAFKAAREKLDEWRRLADRLDPYSFFARVLSRDNGRRRFLDRLGAEAEDVIGEFLTQAFAYEASHIPSLEGFLAWLEASDPEIKRDTETGRDEVRVMTVHGAKGLEAPIVFLVDGGMQPVHPSHDPRIISLFDDRDGDPHPLVWMRRLKDMPAIAQKRVKELRDLAEEEYRRLLYVAMTRAEDRLYICGTRKKMTEKMRGWHGLVSTALEGECVEVRTADGTLEALEWRAEPQRPRAPKGEQRSLPIGPPQPPWLNTPAPLPPPAPRRLSPSAIRIEEQPILPPRVRELIEAAAEAAMERGRLIHRLLESLPEIAPARRREVGARYLEMAASDDVERGALLDSVLAILADPAFGAVFAPGSRAEVEVTGRIETPRGPAVLSGRIDRLAVTGEGVVIVDYKTNRPAPDRLEDVPEGYIAQLSLYRHILERLYPAKPITAAILWTERPVLMEIPSSTLAAALATITAM